MPPPGVCLNIMNERNKKNGRGSPTNPDKFLDQDFEQLQKYCTINRKRYIDDMFPPDRRSIGNGVLQPDELARVVWQRPRKLVENPCFILDGLSRFDFGQGAVGNCWFLASIGALTFQKHIMEQIIPMDQSFQEGEGYVGLFHFRFWRFGKWVDVVIDDKLPLIDGRLVFVRSKTPNEFWAALMEKAYAKVCGSYADMNAGTVSEALMDFTGGIHRTFKLDEAPPDLWDIILRAAQSKSLMGCGTPQGATSANTVLPNGIVQGHAYTITGVTKLMTNNQSVKLLRLFNPHGHGEWNGNWSDKSNSWQSVSPEDRTKCLSIRDDGEFWMSMEDFCSSYADMDICCLSPDFLDGSSECHWTSKFHDGRWVAGTTAGGCMNYRESFWTNPQYHIKLDAVDDECASEQGPNNMLVSLMQKPDKRNRQLVSNLHIGFSVFSVPPEYKGKRGKLPAEFFMRNPVASTKNHMDAREVMEFFRLVPGEYIIVPSTFNPNETASFILTILSKSDSHLEESSSHHVEITKPTPAENGGDTDSKATLFRQYSDQNPNLASFSALAGKSPGFGLDTCRSMVALMDLTVTGRLDGREFLRLWDRVVSYKDLFNRADMTKNGVLSLGELQNAMIATGIQMSDGMLNIMALRYGGSTGSLTLETFVSLILRLDCMSKIFKKMSDGVGIYLQESEWLYLSMYS
ncbi:calpain-1 catalytic subunit-like [Clupea harengus]|uniref:Calpain-1 catalytic subunit-like n=1 Tax=Clupea harengus TaxID=7950 RepID=A0A8M1KVI7_CLUHA|nr:calpain-1 catalytic subunit-like [Clupea harengus]